VGTAGGQATLRVVRLAAAQDLPLPSYRSAGAAGLDLAAAVEAPLVLEPMARAAVPTGLVVRIPDGHEGQVRPRSGLALEHGVTVANAPGTIDSDYRGELRVLLVNLGPAPYIVRRGDRIAQLVLARVAHVAVEAVAGADGGALDATDRGAGGFGSTGR
jgi:dUTP pyrophosphatase